MKKQRIVLYFCLLVMSCIMLTGCRTTSTTAPAFPPVPQRPRLLEVPAGGYVPRELAVNMALLIGYAEELEATLQSYQELTQK